MAVKGSCLCGIIHYEVNKPTADHAEHCHCTYCRKWHGAAFGSYVGFNAGDFRWTKGEDIVARYQSSSHSARHFCPECGSPLAGEIGGKICIVTMGTLDTDPGVQPHLHMFVRSKVPWFKITDDLEQHGEYPPGFEPPET